MEVDSELLDLLRKRRGIDREIARLIAEAHKGAVRFSEKKFVGDLGEYYFYKLAPAFLNIEQSLTSNKNCDFTGTLTDEGRRLLGVDFNDVRIEVKTRHAQVGNNHIFSIDNSKFDLLAFVALADDFTCRHIGIIRGEDIVVDRQNRIKYSDYYNRGLVRWQTTEWTEL
jgi:hypothetical protein